MESIIPFNLAQQRNKSLLSFSITEEIPNSCVEISRILPARFYIIATVSSHFERSYWNFVL